MYLHTIQNTIMSSFNKTEYHNVHPEQGVSLLRVVRDDKSHSSAYFKQANKRNQLLTDTINGLPNKLKNKLALDVPLQHKTLKAQSLRLKIDRPKQVSHVNYYADMADTQDGEADAFAEMELDYDDVVEDVVVEEDVSVNEDALRQYYTCDTSSEYEDEDEDEGEDEYEEAGMSEFEKLPTLEDIHDAHLRNLESLSDYYASSAFKNPSLSDAEYEFWLLFEIRMYEEGNRTDVVDIKQNMPYYCYNNVKKNKPVDDNKYDDEYECTEDDIAIAEMLYSENQALIASQEGDEEEEGDDDEKENIYEYDAYDMRQEEIEALADEARENMWSE